MFVCEHCQGRGWLYDRHGAVRCRCYAEDTESRRRVNAGMMLVDSIGQYRAGNIKEVQAGIAVRRALAHYSYEEMVELTALPQSRLRSLAAEGRQDELWT